jgi:pyruvate kinase
MPVECKSPSQLANRIRELLHSVEDSATSFESLLGKVCPSHLEDARNLLHYLALRKFELRDLQWQLSRFGLSSLGRSEGFVVENLRQILARLDGKPIEDRDSSAGIDLAEGALHANTRMLMGPKPQKRHVYIMVTAPVDPLLNEQQIEDLVRGGMDCLRVNGAHGSEADWLETIRRVRAVEAKVGQRCRVLMDLPGPKIRTAIVGPKSTRMAIKATKDEKGRVLAPARVILIPAGGAGAGLQVSPEFFSALEQGMKIKLSDTREKRRSWEVEGVGPGFASVLVDKTSYLDETTVLRLKHGDLSSHILGGWPESDPWLEVQEGQELSLKRSEPPAESPVEGKSVLYCTSPEALKHLELGHRVVIDDGKAEARVLACSPEEFTLKLVRTSKRNLKIRSEKGLNLPDSRIDLPAMTTNDKTILEFALKNADMVALSFVRVPSDVDEIVSRMNAFPEKGLVIKIETQSGFMNLPATLLRLMQHNPVGVMIARGDLAVECGFERLAEIQEEILWLCEAAHLPCIWATQVLEGLAQSRLPSRAEITDAAMAVRAEVVMLNKGDHIVDAVKTLENVLCRMELHQYKKKALFRPLRVANLTKEN